MIPFSTLLLMLLEFRGTLPIRKAAIELGELERGKERKETS